MRVFIIGNGPSLKKTPLELLEGEHSWAVNRVHLIYPETSWRPTHILFAEMTAGGSYWFPKIWESVRENSQAKKYARDDAWWWTEEMEQYEINRYNACTHHDILPQHVGREMEKAPEEWHFPQICKFGGSVPMTIQLAVQAGYDKMYLLGCDLGHKEGQDNHFHPEYAEDRSITAETAVKRNMQNGMAHQLAFENSPIPIYNATIGGY